MFNGAVLLGNWRIYESDSDGYEGRILGAWHRATEQINAYIPHKSSTNRLYNSFVPVPKPVCAMVCTFSAIV
jgi:hypothetical protein